jgi:hypothetical protein
MSMSEAHPSGQTSCHFWRRCRFTATPILILTINLVTYDWSRELFSDQLEVTNHGRGLREEQSMVEARIWLEAIFPFHSIFVQPRWGGICTNRGDSTERYRYWTSGGNSVVGTVLGPSGRPIDRRLNIRLSTMTRGDRTANDG